MLQVIYRARNAVLGMIHCIRNTCADIVARFLFRRRSFRCVLIPDVVGSILHIAPGLFRMALHLVYGTFIRKTLVIERFTDSLLYLALCNIETTFNMCRIHRFPF